MQLISDPNVMTITGDDARQLQQLKIRQDTLDRIQAQLTDELNALQADISERLGIDLSTCQIDLATGLVSSIDPVTQIATPMSKVAAPAVPDPLKVG